MEETYYCHVCLSNKRFSQGYKLEACGHRFCQDCLSGFLDSQISSRQTHPRCFFVERKQKPCNKEITEGDIKKLSSPQTWQKYTRFSNMDSNSNYVDCPKCKSQQLGDPQNPWIVCQMTECDHEFCFVHQNQHAKEVTCAEFEAKSRVESKRNNAWKAENTKKCPKCHVDTEKNDGCNHMTCYQCKTGWCWLCGEEIGNAQIPDHYKEGKCKGKQFTTETVADFMHPWEAMFCIMLPAFFLLLFSPVAFLMVCVVLLLSPLFMCCICCCDNDDESVANIVNMCMHVCLIGPLLLITLPFWLPCFCYYHCVISPRRNRLPAEVGNPQEEPLVGPDLA